MTVQHPTVPLDRVVSHRKEFIEIDDTVMYTRCRVQIHAQGIVQRDIVSGMEIKTKKQQVCRAGEFLVAEIDAKVGGFGIVPDALDGAIVSSHYFLFAIDPTQLDKRYLDYFVRTPSFRDQVTAQGSTNYAAIRPAHVLSYNIPLPPLDEQRRIVARIDELAAKIEEARGLRREATAETNSRVVRFTDAMLSNTDWPTESLAGLLSENSQNGLSARPSDTPVGQRILRISAATARSDAIVNESDFKYLDINESVAEKYRLLPGDLVACRFNGNLHFVGRFAEYQGYMSEHHVYPDKLIRFRVAREKAMPAFVRLVMNSSLGRESIEKFCATTAGNIGISAGNLKSITLPIPPLEEQCRIVGAVNELEAMVGELQRHQAGTADDLDALLPSVLDRAFKGEL